MSVTITIFNVKLQVSKLSLVVDVMELKNDGSDMFIKLGHSDDRLTHSFLKVNQYLAKKKSKFYTSKGIVLTWT